MTIMTESYSPALVCRTSFQQPPEQTMKEEDARTLLRRASRTERRRTIRDSLSPRISHTKGRMSSRITPCGSVVASDVVYVDNFLTPDTTSAPVFDMNEVYLYSDQDRQFCTKTMTFRIICRHVLRYKGEIVWQLETTCHGSNEGTRGESSNCRLYRNSLRIRIRQKTADVWVGCCPTTTTNSRTERQLLKVCDILRQSAEEYQSEAASSSSSFGGDDPLEPY